MYPCEEWLIQHNKPPCPVGAQTIMKIGEYPDNVIKDNLAD